MQYTRTDIMYYSNGLSIQDSDPSAPSLQGINHLIRYLAGFPPDPIIYPDGLDGNTTHELCQEVSPGDFHSQNIYNDLVDFADWGEGRAHNEKLAIACIVLCIFGVDVNWSVKTPPSSEAQYTD